MNKTSHVYQRMAPVFLLIRTSNCSWFGFQTDRFPAIFYPLDYLHKYPACHFLEFLPDILIAFFVSC